MISEKCKNNQGPDNNFLPRESDGHLYWLDLIRFLAAFAVLAGHFRGAFFVDFSSLPESQQNYMSFCFFSLTRLGHEAVLIFFTLSGFLVGGKGLERILKGQFQPMQYVIDRTVRIMLPLISSLIFAWVVCQISGLQVPTREWIVSLFSLQGIFNGAPVETLWSLTYEVWFYILLCGFGYCICRRGTRKVYLGFITVFIALCVFTKLHSYYLFVWLIGAISWFILPTHSLKFKWVAFGCFMLMIVVLMLTSSSNYMEDSSGISAVLRQCLELLFGLVFCTFFTQMIQEAPSHKWSIKLNDIGTKLAAFSYTLYLTHIPLRDLLRYLGAPKSDEITIESIALYLTWLILAMLLAWAIYWMFERNTPIVKKWVKNALIKAKT